MGIAAFFRWLSLKYPKALKAAIEDSESTEKWNPNGVEFDNLYLDMNGIIHPCTHPVFKEAPKSESEMFDAIGRYIDRLFGIVRPRKLLYLAIDGVAPRAKMNQQRVRRFRAANEREAKNEAENGFDSNCITPGTEFMERLTHYLRYYVAKKLNEDPGWQRIKVILSDSNVPGEGEHKIMHYIRMQRNQPNYEPNMTHCVYGLDADLVMLGLATHEPHFSILREIVFFDEEDACYRCGNLGHLPKDCPTPQTDYKEPFHFLHLSILREYLQYNLNVKDMDPERCIDDWIFLCFFVGNDFLPHLPTLDIRENAIDILVDLYKLHLPKIGYITEKGNINYSHLNAIFQEMAQMQDGILEKRSYRSKLNNLKKEEEESRKHELKTDEQEAEELDSIRLGEEGWKARYYKEKFGIELTNTEYLTNLRNSYVQGLTWVFKYYYHGCPSWDWFYPYYYSPFPSELCGIENFKQPSFTLAKPFSPLSQLMAVLPSKSSQLVPPSYRTLMLDPNSPVIDFYPQDFHIDRQGTKYEWQGVALLPFIDEERLLKVLAPLEKQLMPAEKKRNSVSHDILFVRSVGNQLGNSLQEVVIKKKQEKLTWVSAPTGLNGFVAHMGDSWICEPGELYPAPFKNLENIEKCLVLMVWFKDPELKDTPFCGMLPNAINPPKALSYHDLNYRPRHPFFQKLPEDRTGQVQFLSITKDLVGQKRQGKHIFFDERGNQVPSEEAKELKRKPDTELERERKKTKLLEQELRESRTKISKLEYENNKLKKQLQQLEKKQLSAQQPQEDSNVRPERDVDELIIEPISTSKPKKQSSSSKPKQSQKLGSSSEEKSGNDSMTLQQPNKKRKREVVETNHNNQTESTSKPPKHLILNPYVSISSPNPHQFLNGTSPKSKKKKLQ